MWKDEIVEEIHRIREEHAKAFNYDLDAMFADWQKQEAESGRKIISVPLKKTSRTPQQSTFEVVS